MSDRHIQADRWADDNEDTANFRPLSAQEAQAFRRRHPQLSVWSVVAAQVALGATVSMVAWLISGDGAVAASALYGAAVVAVPSALMARGASGRVSRVSPLVGAISFMTWAVIKIAFSVLMLALASTIVQPLHWPALLLALALCMQTYWVALLWRRR